MEARGLDVMPNFLDVYGKNGDQDTLELLRDVVYKVYKRYEKRDACGLSGTV